MKFKPLWNPTQLTCNLTIGDWPACTGVQKITGFAKGLAFHRVDYFPYWHISNSIVLGYNRSENKDFARLFNYAYFKGKNLQKHIGDFFVGEKLDVKLLFDDRTIAAMVKRPHENFYSYNANFYRPNNVGKFGYQLFPYAEIDGTEIRMHFNPEVRDVVVR
jgi:hypothetical protein